MKKVSQGALNAREEAGLQALISRGKTSARKATRARILLLAHAGEKDGAIARALQTSVSTVERTRRTWSWKAGSPRSKKLPGPEPNRSATRRATAFWSPLACSTPRWGGKADACTPLGATRRAGLRESFSKEAVRRALKKTS